MSPEQADDFLVRLFLFLDERDALQNVLIVSSSRLFYTIRRAV